MEGTDGWGADVSLLGEVSHVSRWDDLFSAEEEAEDEMICV